MGIQSTNIKLSPAQTNGKRNFLEDTMDDRHYGPNVVDGYQVEAAKRGESWYVVSGNFSLLVTGETFQHALATQVMKGPPRVRAVTTSAPDVPDAQKLAIQKALRKWRDTPL